MIGDLINIIKLSLPNAKQTPQLEITLGIAGLLVSVVLAILSQVIPACIPPLQYNPLNPATAVAPLTNVIVPWMVSALQGSAALVTGLSSIRIVMALFRLKTKDA